MRNVKIGVISFERALKGWGEPATREGNIQQALGWIDRAGDQSCDILCLPEAFDVVGTSAMFESGIGRPEEILAATEEFPGPTLLSIGERAKKHAMYVISVNLVRDHDRLHVRATIFERNGEILGFYDKFNPTAYEMRHWGVSPGEELPVFEVDFGRIAILICYDIFFPEMVRIYSFKGAEIVFLSTGNITPNPRVVYEQLRVRASDYSVHLAMSNFGIQPPYAPHVGRVLPSRACIIDHNGVIMADTGHRPGMAVTELDLNEPCLYTVEDFDAPIRPRREDLNTFVKLEPFAREYLALAEVQEKGYLLAALKEAGEEAGE
jgi:predicted amidohydrolase